MQNYCVIYYIFNTEQGGDSAATDDETDNEISKEKPEPESTAASLLTDKGYHLIPFQLH